MVAEDMVDASYENDCEPPISDGDTCASSETCRDAGSVELPTSLDGGKRVLIACRMVEDEVRAALEHTGARLDTIWVERGYHERPDTLRAELQRRIDDAEAGGASQILLVYGLCGGGIAGLRSHNAQLVIPRFDDCVNIMLETGCRSCRGKAQAGVFYLTHGWVHDRSFGPSGMYERYLDRFGERRAKRLMQVMFDSYKSVSLIDNGCYELESVFPIAHEFADTIGVDVVNSVPGSNVVLEKLLDGRWDDDILVIEPGVVVDQDDFNYDSDAPCACILRNPDDALSWIG